MLILDPSAPEVRAYRNEQERNRRRGVARREALAEYRAIIARRAARASYLRATVPDIKLGLTVRKAMERIASSAEARRAFKREYRTRKQESRP